MSSISEIFGCMVFNEDVMRERLPKDVYKSMVKTIEQGKPIDSKIADLNLEEHAMEMFNAGSNLKGKTAEEIFQMMKGNTFFIKIIPNVELIYCNNSHFTRFSSI